MKRFVALSLAVLCALASRDAFAQSVFAECAEPTGWAVAFANGKESSSEDKMTGVHPTFLWKPGEDKATVIMRGGMKVGGPESFDAVVISTNKRMVSFIAHFEGGLEIYSLFLDSGILIMSSHKDLSPFAANSVRLLTGKTMTAKCKIKAG